ncbi:MAG: methyltransferase domain-containing protein [Candidatus Binatia bacterium]
MHGRNAAVARRYYPGYRPPKQAYQEVLDQQVQSDTSWLDIGCGRRVCADKTLNRLLPRRARLTVGCDRDPYISGHSSVRNLVLCDAAALPFRNGVFSLVSASMVLEHLEDPEAVFREVARVSQPGGRFVVFTPNRYNYAMLVAAVTPHRFHVLWRKFTHYLARGQWRDFGADLFPTWYRANSASCLRSLLSRTAFKEERVQYLSLAHSFGFVRPLYVLSLLLERAIHRCGFHILKADILAVFVHDGRAHTLGQGQGDGGASRPASSGVAAWNGRGADGV